MALDPQTVENAAAGRKAGVSVLMACNLYMVEGNRGKKQRVKVTRRSRPPLPGRLVVVSGQCRKVGKTALVVDLIKAFPKYRWKAIKITPYVESGCPLKGVSCRCGPREHTFAIRYERARKRKTDTSRFLEAGAETSIWVETKQGRLKDSLPALASAIGEADNVIIESNAILRYWQSDLSLLVVDPRNADFKSSARKAWRVADAFVFRSPPARGAYPKDLLIPKSVRPKFFHPLGTAIPANMQRFVRQRFGLIDHHKAGQLGRIFS
jgi:hypothetical protein